MMKIPLAATLLFTMLFCGRLAAQATGSFAPGVYMVVLESETARDARPLVLTR